MNENGFGLSTLLAILGVFALCLIVIVIIIEVNFAPYQKQVIEQSVVTSPDKEKINQTVYEALEEQLVEAAKRVLIENSDEQVITSEELLDRGVLTSLEDPNGIECIGYVEYQDRQYKPYLRCPGVYRTHRYQMNLE